MMAETVRRIIYIVVSAILIVNIISFVALLSTIGDNVGKTLINNCNETTDQHPIGNESEILDALPFAVENNNNSIFQNSPNASVNYTTSPQEKSTITTNNNDTPAEDGVSCTENIIINTDDYMHYIKTMMFWIMIFWIVVIIFFIHSAEKNRTNNSLPPHDFGIQFVANEPSAQSAHDEWQRRCRVRFSD